ncbi:hypothetical protein [Dactylosporangium cerinum]
MTIARRTANKVPEVTVYFWIIKVLATTVGETAADLLNMNLGLGLTWTTVVTGCRSPATPVASASVPSDRVWCSCSPRSSWSSTWPAAGWTRPGTARRARPDQRT